MRLRLCWGHAWYETADPHLYQCAHCAAVRRVDRLDDVPLLARLIQAAFTAGLLLALLGGYAVCS